MDKTAIKNFAIWARRKLISDMRLRAGFMGITENGIDAPLPASTSEIQYFDISSGEPVKIQGIEIQMRGRIVAQLEQHAKESGYQTAYDSLIENMASVWFNRLIAIRYMEVNEYFPDQLRMLSSVSEGKQDPDIVSRPFDSDLEFSEKERTQVNDWLDTNKQDALFRFLLLKRCNQLAECLPGLFEKQNDASEFFLRLGFVEKDGLIYHLVHDIPEEDWKDQVQIIGWMYQYYIAEKHDEIVNIYKGTVKKEDIPAATQLFTTDWVVRYMVDNSLGRYWIERHPESNLAAKLGFFVKPKNGEITYIDENVTPEEMTFLDDCMGSGHILVYAFDVLMEIYRERGYSDREAAQNIVENNLFGLDIDDRCAQLAYFSVMMKARSYDRRFLRRGIRPNVYSIQESNAIKNYTGADYLPDARMNEIGEYLVDVFRHAKETGSLITVEAQDYDGYLEYLRQCEEQASYDLEGYYWKTTDAPMLESLAMQAKILSKKYTVVCTNPPYLNKMEGNLKKFVISEYKPYSGDLFSVFIYRNFGLCKQDGYSAFMTPFVWMFIKTYENLRQFIIENKKITTLIQMEYSAFEEATVPICSFVLKNSKGQEPSLCFRLSDFRGGMDVQKNKVIEAIENPGCGYFYEAQQDNFAKIPGSPVAYWVSKAFFAMFENDNVGEYILSDGQNKTGDNAQYLRCFWEVSSIQIGVNAKWIPLAKGGGFRRWYGNIIDIIDWSEEARIHYRSDHVARIIPEYLWYREGITWGDITSYKPSFRFLPQGSTFETAGLSVFVKDDTHKSFILGILNSKVYEKVSEILNPTLHTKVKDVQAMPIKFLREQDVENIVQKNISLSRADWDAFETSWDFKRHPLISVIPKNRLLFDDISSIDLSECYKCWESECADRFKQLKANEEELNRIFIDIYGLQDELTPEVEDKDITVRKADLSRDVRSFISYAVGCMFGRYSLDVDGLAYAGGVFSDQWVVISGQFYHRKAVERLVREEVEKTLGEYALTTDHYLLTATLCSPEILNAIASGDGTELVSRGWEDAERIDWKTIHYTLTTNHYSPDEDNVIPITDQKYLPDDIVDLFCEFLKVVYGEKSLEENLDFIANALGGKGLSSREVIRKYFLNDFFKDHCKIYQKRPIYWLFDSGKQNGFKALVYMHRWDENSIGRVLLYLHKIQEKYEIEVRAIDTLIEHITDRRQEAVEERRRDHLLKQIAEIKEYDERLEHMANEHIDIDLDDGVKVNYEKVQTDRNGTKYKILAPIK